MRVYVSGPYSGGDVESNVAEAIEMGQLVYNNGHIPFIPHLFHFWDQHLPHRNVYEDWMRLCMSFLETCDVLLRLPGESPGADREVERAKELGMKVYYSVKDLLADMKELNSWGEK